MAALSYGAEENPINVLIKERDVARQALIMAEQVEETAKPPTENKVGAPQPFVQSGASNSAVNTFQEAAAL